MTELVINSATCCSLAELEEAAVRAEEEQLEDAESVGQRSLVQTAPLSPPPEQSRLAMREILQTGLLGVVALAALAGVFIFARKLASAELPKVQKV